MRNRLKVNILAPNLEGQSREFIVTHTRNREGEIENGTNRVSLLVFPRLTVACVVLALLKPLRVTLDSCTYLHIVEVFGRCKVTDEPEVF